MAAQQQYAAMKAKLNQLREALADAQFAIRIMGSTDKALMDKIAAALATATRETNK